MKRLRPSQGAPKRRVRPRCPCGKYSRKGHCSTCSPQNFCDQHGKLKRKIRCKICNPQNYCNEHGKVKKKTDCKICSPQNYCDEHGKFKKKSRCITCSPQSFCNQHGKCKKKDKCRTCSPQNFCDQHGKLKRKSHCSTCSPQNYCDQHGPLKSKSKCSICSLQNFCDQHGKLKRKSDCSACSPGNFCDQHGKLKSKSTCKICNPQRFCSQHGELKAKGDCKVCSPQNFCDEHGKLKSKNNCKICSPQLFRVDGRRKIDICDHDLRKRACSICGGSTLCEGCGLYEVNGSLPAPVEYAEGRFGTRLCSDCNPNSAKRNRYSMSRSEMQVFAYLEANVQMHIIHDQPVGAPCGLRTREDLVLPRPDGSYVVVEVDEHAHRGREETCEWAKVLTSVHKCEDKHVLFVRFNPDNIRGGHKVPLEERLAALEKVIVDYDGTIGPMLRLIFMFYPNKEAVHEASQKEIEEGIDQFRLSKAM